MVKARFLGAYARCRVLRLCKRCFWKNKIIRFVFYNMLKILNVFC